VHELVEHLTEDGYYIIVLGDPGHDEVIGIVGHGEADTMAVIKNTSDIPESCAGKPAFISQTTQDVDEFDRLSRILNRRFPGIRIHNTICKPTRRRQEAATELARQCQLVYVVGSPTSANTMRLADISERICGRSMLIEQADQVRTDQLEGVRMIGLTAGASSPDSLIQTIIARICELVDINIVTTNPEFAGIADEVRKK
jgi:4-hydroxy-3-methylbut-2-enyl diphosphate reductase